jgi:hypothetical protein
MNSVTPVTDYHIILPVTLQRHKATAEWLSTSLLWKKELKFFQKLLDLFAPKFTSLAEKQSVDHFQSIITYYDGELIDAYKSKLRHHEKKLSQMLERGDEPDTRYFNEHDTLMNDLDAINKQLSEYKDEFYTFIETAS